MEMMTGCSSRAGRGGTALRYAVLIGLTFMSAALAWAASPVINDVTSSTANGTYGTGSTISVQVKFNQAVTVTGTPQLALNSGGTAHYVSGSTTDTLTFSYTVAASHGADDLDYASTNALTLNGGTIANAGSENAVLTLPSPGAANSLGANKSIVIRTPPLLPPANIAIDNTARPNTIRLTFNEPLDDFEARQASNYTVKNNDGSITYTIEYAILTAPDTVMLYLPPTNPEDKSSFITNQDIARHIKVTPSAFLADQQGYTWTGGTVTEAGGTHTRDLTYPTVSATATASSNTAIEILFSEPVVKALATDKANYTLSGTSGFSGNPTAAALDASGTKVTLTVPSMANLADGKTVIVTVAAAVTDLAGNPVSQSARTATLTVGRAPGALVFTPAVDAVPGALVESNVVTLSGLNVPTAIEVVSGSHASLKCSVKPVGGEWGDFAACTGISVATGDQLKLQLQAAGTTSTTISASVRIAGTTGTYSVTTVGVLNPAAPQLLPSAIQIDNSVQPNTIRLTFSKDLEPVEATTPANYTVTNNAGTISYTIEYAAMVEANIVQLTLAPANPLDAKTFITNLDIVRRLKVTPSTRIADLQGNAWSGGTVTEAGGTHTRDLTAPTVASAAVGIDNTRIELGFSEILAAAAAVEKTNYVLSGTAGFTGNPTKAELDASGTRVVLTVPNMAALADGKTVVVTVLSAVTDLAGNPVSQTARTATLTIGRTPGTLDFNNVDNAVPGSLVESNAVTITGVTIPTAVAVAADSDKSLKCALKPSGGQWQAFADCSTLMVIAGDQIKLQLKSSDKAETPTVSATITIAGTSGTFTVKTATSVIVPAVVQLATLETPSEVLRSPPKAVYVSLNGVLVVPAGVTAPLDVAQAAPNDSGIYLAAGAIGNFFLNGQERTIEAIGSDALLVLKSFTVDGYSGLQTLELSSGHIRVTGGSGNYPVISALAGTSPTKQLLLMPASDSAAPTVDLRRNVDGSVQVAVRSGQVALRLASSASTVVLADLAKPVYAKEVASVGADGQVSQIRVGSLDRNEEVVGDPMRNFPATTGSPPTILASIPRLSAVHERVDANKNLMWALLDTIGPRASMTQAFQLPWGQVPLRVDNIPLYLTPLGDVTVDTTLADGVTLNANGRFELVRSGVKTTLVPTVIDLGNFTAAMQRTYRGYVLMQEDGALEISENGNTLIMQPDLFATPVSGVPDGISVGGDALIRYTYAGQQQILYPRFYDMSQLARTFGDANTELTLRANLDGTVSATIKPKTAGEEDASEVTFLLVPAYNVLSPIGGIPPQHRNDAWWQGDDGLFYIKYANGSAQGFALR